MITSDQVIVYGPLVLVAGIFVVTYIRMKRRVADGRPPLPGPTGPQVKIVRIFCWALILGGLAVGFWTARKTSGSDLMNVITGVMMVTGALGLIASRLWSFIKYTR